LGLGLSTVYGIVERHHGTITAQNHPEGGALFVIALSLPAAR
jgi:signal transduction histidine kinase